MAATIVHRGPDDAGTFVDPNGGYGVGFRRLSILDLQPTGHQPMESTNGDWVITFNGEIYNHRALRSELEADGHRFRGHSDTEVLLEHIARYGVDSTIRRLNGMFAFAAWHRPSGHVTIARDPIGEKPMYLGRVRGDLLFGSELKALHAGGLGRSIRPDGVASYLRWGYVRADQPLLHNLEQLTPGTFVEFGPGAEELRRVRYYSPVEVAQQRPAHGSTAELADELDALLRDAVALRLDADVPVGAFLSGGIDSSLVCAIAQSLHPEPVRTYSIGFDDPRYDESPHAAAVAAHLGTRHRSMTLTPQDCLDVVPKLAAMYDEPFADSSAIPTYLVATLAREEVTVALSGDGGDEVFGGYERYRNALRFWAAFRKVPTPIRSVGGLVAAHAPQRALDAMTRRVSDGSPDAITTHRIRRLGDLARSASESELYDGMNSLMPRVERLVLGARAPLPDPSLHRSGLDHYQLTDQLHYLPEDILVKVDRATMATSLEGRIPLLDPRIVEFGWTLPPDQRVANGRGKVVPRALLSRYVPDEIINRPKAGFTVPIGDWLRGPLRSWGDDLLDPLRLRADGVLNPPLVQRLWSEHQSGSRNHENILWALLMFQEWAASLHAH